MAPYLIYLKIEIALSNWKKYMSLFFVTIWYMKLNSFCIMREFK